MILWLWPLNLKHPTVALANGRVVEVKRKIHTAWLSKSDEYYSPIFSRLFYAQFHYLDRKGYTLPSELITAIYDAEKEGKELDTTFSFSLLRLRGRNNKNQHTKFALCGVGEGCKEQRQIDGFFGCLKYTFFLTFFATEKIFEI